MNIDRVMAEVGRLYLQTVELGEENAMLRQALAEAVGQATVSESESDPRDPRGPSDGTPEQDG